MKRLLFLVAIFALVFTLCSCGGATADGSGTSNDDAGNVTPDNGDTKPDNPPHEHNFVNGECSCGEKDPTYVPPHEHNFVNGECSCGEKDPTYVPPHEHNFVNGECSCGEKDPTYVPPHEHNFIDGKCECGEVDPNYVPALKEITGVTFDNKTVTYNGKEQSIEISGTLPKGVSVTYSNASGVDANTYNATATLSGDGYATTVLSAKLIINKADITGIKFESYTGTYNGSEQMVIIMDALPSGTSVTYENNKAFNAGTYKAIATITGKNYNTLVLSADLIIKKADISGVSFADKTVTYNGKEQSIAISGTLPKGVSVTYSNASGIDANTYNATATLSGDNYNTQTLSAKLIINKADITSISADSEQTVRENGKLQKPEYKGSLPDRVYVKYYFDGVEDVGVASVGSYNVLIVFYGDNYNTLSISVNLTIQENIDWSAYATKIINAFGSIPDPWSFLPDSFTKNTFCTSATMNYDDFVSVSDIPTNGMGKQLHMVYSVVTKADTALGYVNTVYGSMNVIKSLYTAFLDSSPEDYKSFSDTAMGITFTITITEDQYILSAMVGNVEVVIFSDLDDETYGARIQLTKTTVLKYTVSGESLTIAIDILDSVASMLTFARNNGQTVGMIYEYATIGGVDIIANSSMLQVGDQYTVIIGTKGDFLIGSEGRNSEVYDNKTGKFVGAEVREDTKTGVYNTYWFPLNTLLGVDSIKKLDEANKTNPDTIWINGCEDTLHSKLYLGLSLKAGSRRFDIEFKDTYFFTYDEEKGKYTETCMEIPMLFIQEEKIDDFIDDFSNANEVALNEEKVMLIVSDSVREAIATGYNKLLPVYDENKDLITKEVIQNFCKS